MTKNSLYLVAALFLVSAALYYLDSPDNFLGKPNGDKEETKIYPYAVADNTATEYYSDEGLLDYTFNAIRLEHYRVPTEEKNTFEEYTLIKEPRIVIYLPDKSWYIESRNGKISDQGQVITLWNQVKVSRKDFEDTKTELSTDQLTVLPKEKFAETDEPVKIVSTRGELNATGMEVSFADKKIKLLSQVRARHDAF